MSDIIKPGTIIEDPKTGVRKMCISVNTHSNHDANSYDEKYTEYIWRKLPFTGYGEGGGGNKHTLPKIGDYVDLVYLNYNMPPEEVNAILDSLAYPYVDHQSKYTRYTYPVLVGHSYIPGKFVGIACQKIVYTDGSGNIVYCIGHAKGCADLVTGYFCPYYYSINSSNPLEKGWIPNIAQEGMANAIDSVIYNPQSISEEYLQSDWVDQNELLKDLISIDPFFSRLTLRQYGARINLTPDDFAFIQSGALPILHHAFLNSGVYRVEFPKIMDTIQNYTFDNCVFLTYVTLPENLMYIMDNAFNNCRALRSIVIPETVTRIGNNALRIGDSGSNNNATITFLGTTPPTITTTTFNTSYLNKIIVPAGCGDTYKSDANWSTFADYIEEATA